MNKTAKPALIYAVSFGLLALGFILILSTIVLIFANTIGGCCHYGQ